MRSSSGSGGTVRSYQTGFDRAARACGVRRVDRIEWVGCGLAVLTMLCAGGCQRPTTPAGRSAVEQQLPSEGEAATPKKEEVPENATLYPTVRIDTTLGAMDVQLNAERAPITTVNFLEYVGDGYYNGTIFHRVVDTMIQGGRYDAEMNERRKGLRDPIKCESGNGLINRRGTIGMVRKPGIPDSARAEFYINRTDNFDLESLADGVGMAVFGKVIRGIDVLDAIGRVEVGTHPRYAAGRSAVVPTTPVVIKSITVLTPLDWPRARELARLASLTQEEMRDRLIAEAEQESGNQAVRLPSGLIYVDLQEGSGAMPTPEDRVEVFYRGTLMNGTEFEAVLDETRTFDMDNVIEGWKEGLSTMREGGRRVLFIPPELGFGATGIPGKIPGGAWLRFEVELLLVTPKPPDEIQP